MRQKVHDLHPGEGEPGAVGEAQADGGGLSGHYPLSVREAAFHAQRPRAGQPEHEGGHKQPEKRIDELVELCGP